jgi:hypothetical protein
MTTLKEQIAADLAVFYDTNLGFAESVAYYPREGNPKSVPVIIDYGMGYEYRGSDDYGITATARIRVSDLASPLKMDTVVITGTDWAVIDAKKSVDGLEWVIQLNRIND